MFLPLEQVPQSFLKTLLSSEDRTFLEHGGVSFKAIVRSAVQNIAAGRVVSGGSTITQQLVRTLLGPGERTYLRKAAEAILAIKLDLLRSKHAILEEYVNTAYFGHQAYGIRSAAQTYLGKNVGELSLSESAFLVGLLQSPSTLDPFRNYAGAVRRRDRVIDASVDAGIMNAQSALEAKTERVTLAQDRQQILAPHFVFWVLDRNATALQGKREVRTTLDLPLQEEVERIVSGRLAALADKKVTSAAVVVLDAHTGDVLAMVGSSDYFDTSRDGQVNVALAPRQPGSALKPFTYALALQKGDTAASTIADVETQFFTQEGTPYVPRNYDYGEHGLVRYREALANSYNIAAVKVLQRVGVGALLSLLRNAGIQTLNESPEHYGLALTLGDAEVRLLELAQAYGIFPRAGRTLSVRTLPTEEIPQGEKLLDPRVAWLITDILSDPLARLPEFGEENPLTFSRPVAAKTGTTRNSRDNWTMGFTPDRIVGVWVGNADNTPMQDTSGVTGAGPIFHDVMEAAVRLLPPTPFVRPAGIVDRTVCRLSGLLPGQHCTDVAVEHFVEGTQPTQDDTMERSIPIDERTHLLADGSCDPQYVRNETFVVWPLELQKWAREQGWPQAPTTFSPLCEPQEGTGRSAVSPGLLITSPHDGDSFELDPLIPDRDEKIPFIAQTQGGTGGVTWFVNGEEVGNGARYDWQPKVGRFTVEAKAGSGSAHVRIEVRNR